MLMHKPTPLHHFQLDKKVPKKFVLVFVLMTLFAASCGNGNQNELQRPISEIESGEVAGTETTNLQRKIIKINQTEVRVEVADNDASRTQGLSGRKKLDEGTGLLFDFTNTNYTTPGFWMKDMLISIDIIWIKDGKIIGIEKDIPLPVKDKTLPVYNPPSEISHVLEVPTGWSAKNNFQIGDIVSL